MERAYRIRPCTIIDFRGAKPLLGRLFLGGLFRLANLFAPFAFDAAAPAIRKSSGFLPDLIGSEAAMLPRPWVKWAYEPGKHRQLCFGLSVKTVIREGR
jgi:hypothetical protein